MKILISGDMNSIYLYQYIQNVLLDDKFADGNHYFAFHEGNNPINNKYLSFYKMNGIKVYEPVELFGILNKIPKVRWIHKRLNKQRQFTNFINKIGNVDVVHFHYIRREQYHYIRHNRHLINKVILTFWGSDFLRATQKEKSIIRKIVEEADTIVASPSSLENQILKYCGIEFKNKCKAYILGAPAVECIKNISFVYDKETIKKNVNYPIDRLIITCGYNGARAQQHEMIIEALSGCGKSIKEKIFLIFPVGYGLEVNYRSELESKLSSSGLEYLIDENFYNIEEIAKRRIASDIFIHAQTTDAYSSSIIEFLAAGNVLINGKWIEYPILNENNIEYKEFMDVNSLTSTIDDIITHYEFEKQKAENQRTIMYKLRSWSDLKNDWKTLYELESKSEK